MQRTRIAGIDIDGVLADPTHRLHHLEGRPRNWPAFFGDAHADPALEQGRELVDRLASDGVTILYVSGRPTWLRRSTMQWLARHGFPDAPIYLRGPRDFRPAAELKLEIFTQLSAEYDVALVVDDDERVVAALREAGFSVQQADWYRPPAVERAVLARAQEAEGRT